MNRSSTLVLLFIVIIWLILVVVLVLDECVCVFTKKMMDRMKYIAVLMSWRVFICSPTSS